MSLLDRTISAEKCAVAWCDEERVEGGEFCGSAGNRHRTENQLGRLVQLSDGTYASRVAPAPFVPVWLRNLKPKELAR